MRFTVVVASLFAALAVALPTDNVGDEISLSLDEGESVIYHHATAAEKRDLADAPFDDDAPEVVAARDVTARACKWVEVKVSFPPSPTEEGFY
jgi:hypothetical protein